MEDELVQLCLRLVGEPGLAARAAEEARPGGGEGLERVARALQACRELTATGLEPSPRERPEDAAAGGAEPEPSGSGGLAAAVAAELATASARLPPRQREILALRDHAGLSHADIARVTGADPDGVALLLARARLRLRGELRGATAREDGCPERERALRTVALRQDGEPVPEADDGWLLDHLRHCVTCTQAHSAMVEAAACYRAWRVPAQA